MTDNESESLSSLSVCRSLTEGNVQTQSCFSVSFICGSCKLSLLWTQKLTRACEVSETHHYTLRAAAAWRCSCQKHLEAIADSQTLGITWSLILNRLRDQIDAIWKKFRLFSFKALNHALLHKVTYLKTQTNLNAEKSNRACVTDVSQ